MKHAEAVVLQASEYTGSCRALSLEKLTQLPVVMSSQRETRDQLLRVALEKETESA